MVCNVQVLYIKGMWCTYVDGVSLGVFWLDGQSFCVSEVG